TLRLAREALTEALAAQLLAGKTIAPDTLVKIDALLADNLPPTPHPGIDVHLIRTDSQFENMKVENAAQAQRIAELEAALATRALAGGPGGGEPASSDSKSSSPPAPTNVLPLWPAPARLTAEEIAARKRQVEVEMGATVQSRLASSYPVDGPLIDDPYRRG